MFVFIWKPIDIDCDKLTSVMKDLYGRQIFTTEQLVWLLFLE